MRCGVEGFPLHVGSATITPMRTIADDKQVAGLIDSLAAAINTDVKEADGATDWGLVGIRSRGDVLAHRLVERLDAEAFDGRVGSLDITLYRDDLSEIGPQPVVRTTDIPFDVDGLNVVLVDDVLMSGRSIRAALQSLMDLGRPKRVWLCVLVDRGGRELPIAPDHAAMDLTGEKLLPGELVEVELKPTDRRDAVVVRTAEPAQGTGT